MRRVAFSSVGAVLAAATVTWAGDLAGSTNSSQTVVKVNGTTVPTGGALTTGNGLYVTGVSALSYSALNLAGGANYVTGALPAANQASQTAAGDVTGLVTSATVVSAITGASNLCTVAVGTALRWGTSVATVGLIRHPNAIISLAALNAAGNADIVLAATDSGNNGYIGGSSKASTTDRCSELYLLAASSIQIFPFATSANSAWVFNTTGLVCGVSVVSPIWTQTVKTTDAAAQTMTVRAQGAWSSASTNVNGATLILQGGVAKTDGTTGLRKGVRLDLSSNAVTMIEATEVIVGFRKTALNMATVLTTTSAPVNTGDLVTLMGNCLTAPMAPAVGACILYSETGAFKAVGTSGTFTTLAPA